MTVEADMGERATARTLGDLVAAIGRAGGRPLGELWLPAGEVPDSTVG